MGRQKLHVIEMQDINSSSVYAFHKLKFQNSHNISDEEGMIYQVL